MLRGPGARVLDFTAPAGANSMEVASSTPVPNKLGVQKP